MPELPEVETVRRGLTDRLVNFQIQRVEVFRERAVASPGGSEEFKKNLTGLYVGRWQRRGKYLFASLHRSNPLLQKDNIQIQSCFNDGFWGVHLRMTGYFQWHEYPTPPCSHTRASFWNYEGNELRFVDVRSFGEMWWVPPGNPIEKIITGLKRLGPEPFSNDFNATYLRRKFKGSKRTIKATLLDQSIVAGTGNIYADESLFAAGIRPNKPVGELKTKELKRLCQSLAEVMTISIGKGGTTFSDFRDLEGINGNYGGEAWVYRRSDKPCRNCGEPIKKDLIAGRSTHWCPKCQL
ncbi:DNA-formamidopyrimidine glycosylase [Prochlorococcus sp. MIT 1300]|uniref:DNA-formamidopyrimidine glycosylase n=1 Tax=Prochlorococcus sp. MIT 1300 TaxID=3096218 RepID=UPI002A764E87|nr:DNA-formamidopyrimidine glycosylase [Prochlorococcus sp. MIT 1300]